MYKHCIYFNVSGDGCMEVKLKKWGNSDGIRIPNTIIKSLGLKTNDKLDLEVEDNKIIISKAKTKEEVLEEKFKNYKGDNLTKEFTWDEPRGKEIW